MISIVSNAFFIYRTNLQNSLTFLCSISDVKNVFMVCSVYFSLTLIQFKYFPINKLNGKATLALCHTHEIVN